MCRYYGLYSVEIDRECMQSVNRLNACNVVERECMQSVNRLNACNVVERVKLKFGLFCFSNVSLVFTKFLVLKFYFYFHLYTTEF